LAAGAAFEGAFTATGFAVGLVAFFTRFRMFPNEALKILPRRVRLSPLPMMIPQIQNNEKRKMWLSRASPDVVRGSERTLTRELGYRSAKAFSKNSQNR
jgi:hypothetical protein